MHGALSRARRALAAVGQMALSNYLLHSIVASVLFLGWGFGLAGRLTTLSSWRGGSDLGVQLALSPVWLAHYRFGPAEWLWRSLTYWRWQPIVARHRTLRFSDAFAGR